jgi:DNA replication protein DnaC
MLKRARLDNSYEAEIRRILAVDLLILDDFAIDVLDPTESRDLYEIHAYDLVIEGVVSPALEAHRAT